MSLRQLCNATYALLAEGMDEKELARLDRTLNAPVETRRTDGRPPAITDDILSVMRFMPPPQAAQG